MLLKAYLWWENLKARLRREDGQALTEYAIIIALIAVVVIGTIAVLGNKILAVFQNIVNGL